MTAAYVYSLINTIIKKYYITYNHNKEIKVVLWDNCKAL